MPASLQHEAVRFEVSGHHGERDGAFRPTDLGEAVASLVDPASARETLHWDRNYLYAVRVETASGPVEVVVKQFRNQGLMARLERRLKGSKAARSWRGARALLRAGIPTPRPLMLVESADLGGPSHFVSRRLEGFIEARYYFRALNEGREREEFSEVTPKAFLTAAARTLRRLHDAGIWHRDVSVGNLLVVPAGGPDGLPVVHLVDLNRARPGCRLTVGRRTRDLSRLRIFRAAHRKIFLDSYWEGRTAGMAWKRLLFRFHFRAFLLKRGLKDAFRRPLRGLRRRMGPRHAHVHLPEPPAGSSSRDRVVWDRLSDQPHQHAGRLERLSVRLRDAGGHLVLAGRMAKNLPRILSRARELRESLYQSPVAWNGVGVALRPWARDPEALIEAVERLGLRHALLRLHPWDESHEAEEALARALHARGIDLTFALPQNRDLVRDPARWRDAVTRLGESFLPYGRRFQLGQAINRSKWGVWTHREYLELATSAGAILRALGPVELLGPAVIDWEPYVTAAVLNADWGGFRFDIVSSLLYVDRRGAPENRQLGQDTVGKVVQLRAVAETSLAGSERSWITEVNWPLREGPHSPAGRSVVVDEETQADYLVRYYLLALGTGLVERVYWWQLLARGYGLVYEAEGRLRRRPAFRALATLGDRLAGSTFLGPLEAVPPAHLYLFRTVAGDELVVGWSRAEAARARLPRPAIAAVARGGEALPRPDGLEIELSASPVYYLLEAT